MKKLVVVESMWGNTRAVADAVGRGLGEDAVVVDVRDAPTALAPDLELLVVGGPTHAFSMSRSTTRHDAVARGAAECHEETGIREWLSRMATWERIDVATFDTRIAKAKRLPGSAAKAAGREIRHHRLGRLVATESFYVEDMQGPLLDGEIERAAIWGARLADCRRTAKAIVPSAMAALGDESELAFGHHAPFVARR
jgi:hypothetical protein